MDALMLELHEMMGWIRNNGPVRTLYFGGGTPSALPPQYIARFISYLRKQGDSVFSPEEITLEVNPEDVDKLKAIDWSQAGITRFSMGVQSLVPQELHAIGRRHTCSQVAEATDILRNYGNLSLDLICGLPKQTFDSFCLSLEGIINLQPHHISIYMLEIEEDSALKRLLKAGKTTVPGEQDVEKMYHHLCKRLTEAGFLHYEISNFALPGFHSIHNSSYWNGTPYLGLGPGAASFLNHNTRSVNDADLEAYINKEYRHNKEYLSADERNEEYILTRLRTANGIDLNDYRYHFGDTEQSALLKRSNRLIKQGLLIHSDNRLRLNGAKACLVSDAIMVELFR